METRVQPELYRESLSEKNGQLMEGGMHKGKQKQLKMILAELGVGQERIFKH